MDESPDAAPADRRAPRLRTVAAALVVVTTALGALWWATHPQRLGPVGNELRVPGVVGQPVVAGLFVYPESGSVVLRNASPRVVPGGAAAEVRILWCAAPTGGTPVGALRVSGEAACARTPALAGQQLTRPTEATRFGHLVVEIVPLEPGEVTVEGAEVAYSDGLQRGEQAAGVVVTVAATG